MLCMQRSICKKLGVALPDLEKFVKRRQRLVGPNSSTLKAMAEEPVQGSEALMKARIKDILDWPHAYIGSTKKRKEKLWVWEDNKMVNRLISYVPGLYNIFEKVIVDVADKKRQHPEIDRINVTIDVENKKIEVYNNGIGIPIHREEAAYKPEKIFGHLPTNSNTYLANIFSSKFTIENADGNYSYKQEFSNNMETKTEPTITPCNSDEKWTRVSFKPDLSKFKMKHFDTDIVALMKKRVVDLAGCLGEHVKVELDGESVLSSTFEQYVDVYLKSPQDTRIYDKVNEKWEICVSMAADGHFKQVSFVNNIPTREGGTHVDYITNQITKRLVRSINKKNMHANLEDQDVKNYLWVFINCHIDNPEFDSQTKKLTSEENYFGSTCKLSPKFLKKVEESKIKDMLLDHIKRRKVNIDKLEEANFAGTAKSGDCTLILTEGDSAKAFAMSGLSVVGRDFYGVFPLKGKLLNVKDASSTQLKENAQIQNIMKILGLQYGQVYDHDKVKSLLRYGHLMIMADQDHDGSHIKGLVINFIHTYWPSLLEVTTFLQAFITPIVKVTHKTNKSVLPFYTIPEYEAWSKTLGDEARDYEVKYYKGLGTHSSDEGAEYFTDLDKHTKDFVWTGDKDGEAIQLAFSKKKGAVERRQDWIKLHKVEEYIDSNEKQIPLFDFFNKEFILFAKADLQRSIPSMVDGLKLGQRKILFGAFKKPLDQEIKVDQFCGYISEQSAYHHGTVNLDAAIIAMAQNFVGTNNLPLLCPIGQFGTRNMGGSDHAAARYLYTKLSHITSLIFHKADEPLLNYLNEDGQSIQPTWYLPIIPMVLVNGSEGIGTGWSTRVPSYNPMDIIANLRQLLLEKGMTPMVPWYKNFKGKIKPTNSTSDEFTTTGVFKRTRGKNIICITELPIGSWTNKYKMFLEEVLQKGIDNEPIIEGYKVHDDDVNSVHFEVTLTADQVKKAKREELEKKLKLTSSLKTSNMHVLDKCGVIKKYKTPLEIIRDFYNFRLPYYESRKQAVLCELKQTNLILENKIRFIDEVLKGLIVLSNDEDDIYALLKERNFIQMPNEEIKDGNRKTIPGTEYDYLMLMPIKTVPNVKMRKQLQVEWDIKRAKYDKLQHTKADLLWLADLQALDDQLRKDNSREKEEEKEKKEHQEKAMSANDAEPMKTSNETSPETTPGPAKRLRKSS